MAEVLVQFDADVLDANRRAYIARVCGREVENGLWEGWIEFEPRDGGVVLRTPRETTQPNRTDLDYWASGLTATYIEGALQRALNPEPPDLRPREVSVRPAYKGPAGTAPESGRATTAQRTRSSAVLDPFEVYAQGEDVLVQELVALDEGHLRNIVRAYDLLDEDSLDLQAVSRAALVEMIVSAVRRRAG